MAVGTVTKITAWKNGNKRESILDVVGTGSYTTGGDSLTATQLGLRGVQHATVTVKTGTAGGYVGEYDITNSKLVVYRQKDPAAAGGADIALPEVGSTTDLSAVTFRIRAVGF